MMSVSPNNNRWARICSFQHTVSNESRSCTEVYAKVGQN